MFRPLQGIPEILRGSVMSWLLPCDTAEQKYRTRVQSVFCVGMAKDKMPEFYQETGDILCPNYFFY